MMIVRSLQAGAIAVCLIVLFGRTVLAAEPRVVVSIAPLHSLVAGVMDGVTMPELLVPGAVSPHAYSLKPMDARRLQQADMIVWFGPDLENFLSKPVATLGQGKTVLQVNKLEGLETFPMRDPLFDVVEEDHDDHGHKKHDDHGHKEERADKDHDDHGHHHDSDFDPHTWLSISNAQVIVSALADRLGALDQSNQAIYRTNKDKMLAALDQLQVDLQARLNPVAGRSFITFHDAYQYFEQSFGLRSVGMVVLNHDQPLSAKRVKSLRHKISETGARCIFTEPQFNPKKIDIIVEGKPVKTASLDPIGRSLTPGKMLYSQLMEAMADSFTRCLE